MSVTFPIFDWHFFIGLEFVNVNKNPEETVESLKDGVNKINILPYIHVESFLGLEKTLKQYHKLTDGTA